MLRADPRRDVVDVTDDGLGADVVVAEEGTDAADADDTTGLGAFVDLLVGDVAHMLAQGQRIGMREDDWLLRDFHDLEAGLASGMRAVHQHADPVDLLYHGSAERGQTAVLVMAAGG